LIRTSPSLGVGIGISLNFAGLVKSSRTSARIVFTGGGTVDSVVDVDVADDVAVAGAASIFAVFC